MSSMFSDDAPAARLCHVKKWEDFNGYGFNLHAEKGKAGQFIGKVDENSPADSAGLKEGDRIVEVNGTNIGNENHQQVVQRVKTVPNETKLLVVDSEADAYFKEKKIVVRGDLPNVMKITCADTSSGQPEIEGGDTNDTAPMAMGSPTTESEPVSDSPSRPRHCHMKIWPDFAGYGFNLHAEKGKPGQFIGKVDEGSPAEMAGLREGDRIMEVNDKVIAQDNHQQVVQKIKEYPNETKMLVLDAEGDKYYRDNDIQVTSSMAEVVVITCPDNKPTVNGNAQVEAEVNHDTTEENEAEREPEVDEQQVNGEAAALAAMSSAVDEHSEQDTTEKEQEIQDELGDYEVVDFNREEEEKRERAETPPPEPYRAPTPEPEPYRAPTPEPAPAVVSTSVEKKEEAFVAREPTPPPPASPVSPGPVTIAGIEFAGSVAEAKARAGSRRKADPRADTNLSMKDKYDMFQKL